MVGKKEAPDQKTKKKQAVNKGEGYVCAVCGLSVIVDDACGCVETHEIFCCEQPMKQRKSRAKVAKK